MVDSAKKLEEIRYTATKMTCFAAGRHGAWFFSDGPAYSIMNNEHNDRAHDRNEHAVQIEPGHPGLAQAQITSRRLLRQ